jgi:DNA helicase II / ATP-dependent DNA helicase PcrA
MSYRENLKARFDEEYHKLNDNQRKAVDAIEGPVMVIAGPGTGKTQILAARIGRILLNTDALPQNILCLTYTDAGVVAMRKRLAHFIGPDAYKVSIGTFHSFCNEVIQENLSHFEKSSLSPVSELERIQLFKSLVDRFPKNHVLKRYRGDVYYEVKNLQRLFSDMKREGWTPDFLRQSINAYLEKIKTDEKFIYKNSRKGQYEKGDYKPTYEEEILKMEKLMAAVNEFDNFQSLMRARNLYDFDDMINWVIRAFEENKNLLATYQERYQYILVDEYQDTSGTQNRIVELLISYWENPNIFVVGDDDQSIFRFQGANIENMFVFANNYSDLLKIVLTNNYRSTQPILDISKTLISSNNERLINKLQGLSKELVSSKEALKDLLHLPEIWEYRTAREEMAGITTRVRSLLDKGVHPGRIAVIYRENKYGEELARHFQIKDIPVYTRRSINILEDPFARKVIQILRYLAAEHDIPYGGDELLFEILHFDFYQLPPIEIAKLTVEVNESRYKDSKMSLRRRLYEKSNTPPSTLFDKGMDAGFRKFSDNLEQLIARVSNTTLQTLFLDVLHMGGILPSIMKSDDKVRQLQMLNSLFDFLKEETSRNPLLNLQQFVDIIELMEKEGISITINQVTGNERGVNLLTVHGSKGLEFEHVFFAGCNSHVWESKKNPGTGYKIPDTVFMSTAVSDNDEELRRLFYVALTRAETNLHISYVKTKADGKEAEPSMFIEEILEQHLLPVEQAVLSQEELMDYDIMSLHMLAPEIEKAEEDFISGLLDKFNMNVTALNNYLRCPLEFYYRSLIRIPVGKSESTEFGNAIHYALQRLFEKMQSDPLQKFCAIEDTLADFSSYMNHHREHFTPEAFARRLEQGEIVLRSYCEKYTPEWNKIVAIERNIRNVFINGVPIKGKIDKIEFTGNQVNVVDYKTGDVNSKYTKEKLIPPNEKSPNGGDYWRQAVFYKILIDNYDKKQWTVVSAEFDFVEPDKKNKYYKIRFTIHPQDIETVKQQISEVWAKIQARDFYTGCGQPDCHWCNFAKENKLAVVLHDVEEEEV